MGRPLVFILIITFLLQPRTGRAAFKTIPLGVRPAGLAGAFVALANDANAVLLNPAGISLLDGTELTTFHTRLYGIDDLRRMMAAVAIPTPVGGVGVFMHSLGGDLYRESVFGISYSRALSQRLFLGTTIRMLKLAINSYGATHGTAWDAGVLILLPSGVQAGLKMEGIRRSSIAGRSDTIPRSVRLGLSRTGGGITIAVQFDLEQGRPVAARIGQEFRVMAPVIIRTGLLTSPSVFFAGLGIEISRLEASYTASSHPILGATHRVGLSVRFRG